MPRKKSVPDNKIYIYAQNSIFKLAEYEESHKEKWLNFQKENNHEGSFVYAFQLYNANKYALYEKGHIAQIISFNNNKYILTYSGEIQISKNQ